MLLQVVVNEEERKKKKFPATRRGAEKAVVFLGPDDCVELQGQKRRGATAAEQTQEVECDRADRYTCFFDAKSIKHDAA